MYYRKRKLVNYDALKESWDKRYEVLKANKPECFMLYRAKRRAKKLGLPFDLTVEDVTIPEFCPILGIRLATFNQRGASLRSSASLDRIVPALGYVRGNVIVISHKANSIKNDATPEEILAVGNFYANLQKKTGDTT